MLSGQSIGVGSSKGTWQAQLFAFCSSKVVVEFAGHGLQIDSSKNPATHKHLALPVSPLVHLLLSQGVHSVEPSVAEKESTGHSVHVVAFASENEPAGHKTGDADALAQNDPAGQARHVAEPMTSA